MSLATDLATASRLAHHLGDHQDLTLVSCNAGRIDVGIRAGVTADDVATVLGLLFAALDDGYTDITDGGRIIRSRFDGVPVRVRLLGAELEPVPPRLTLVDTGSTTVGHALGVTVALVVVVALMALAGAVETGWTS